MPSEVKAYKCDWCARCFGRLLNANQHQAACNNNPKRKNCKTCVHGVMDYSQGPFCDYHKMQIIEKPFFVECDQYQDGWSEDRPEPGTCWYYEYKGKAEWTKSSGSEGRKGTEAW